jgi:scyllo-inositol 2-dehydrogenase (NADP+)
VTARPGDIRVGIIGYGLAGSIFHAPLVASTSGLAVAAIVTGNPERRERAAREHPAAAIYPTADAMLERAADLDLAVVATPNRDHARLGVAAMEAGLAVVVDKPMATTAADAARLIETATRTGRLLTVFHNRRWDSDFATVRQLIAGDLLGPVVRFESRYERSRPAVRPGAWRETTSIEEGGGLLFDLGAHLIDQARLLFGPPLSVYAEASTRRPGAAVDDDIFVALRFAGDPVAHLWMSMIPRRIGPRFRVVGIRGVYEKHGLDPQEEALRDGGRPGDAGWGAEPAAIWGRITTEVAGVAIDGTVESQAGRYQAFYAGVRDALVRGAPPPVDPADGMATVAVIEAAHRSARTGQVIALLGR